MNTSTEMTGTSFGLDETVWEPLIAAVGEELVADFMCMFGVLLADARRMYAFKHIDTRGYLHLTEDGEVFYYVWTDGELEEPARYRKTTLGDQLQEVLSPLWEHGLAGATPERVAACERAIRAARRKDAG